MYKGKRSLSKIDFSLIQQKHYTVAETDWTGLDERLTTHLLAIIR